MPIKNWSTTASNNNAAVPNGFPEGMPPSGVNDSGRQLMADVRAWYEDNQWADLGHVPTRLSASQFSVTGDHTDKYIASRGLRFTGSSTVYARIASASYGAGATVVTMTTSTIPATLSTVSLSASSLDSLPDTVALTTGTTFTGSVFIHSGFNIENVQPNLVVYESDAAADEKRWLFQWQGGDMTLRTYNDAYDTSKIALEFNRTGNALASITYGNATDTPSHAFYGAVTVNGDAAVTGTLTVGGTAVSVSGHVHSGADLTSGSIPDARITLSSVTQHQSGLSLAGTQITSGTVADARLSSNVALKNAAANFTSTLQRSGNAVVSSSNGTSPNITRGTGSPSGGSDGDIYFQYT